MDYSKVEKQLGDWGPKFRPFIESADFDEIFAFLKKQGAKPPDGEGKIICPEHHNVFRVFRETLYSNLKAIFILQDPYPWIKNDKYVADGVPMSCSNTGICQPSLDLFYDGISDDLGIPVVHHPDLTYLCKQGVLFLNTSLTVELNKPTSHKGIWDKFIYYLIEEVINFYNTGTCYVSLGKNAQVFGKAVIPFLHWGFEVEHPAAAAHTERAWKHQNVFSKINRVLKNSNNTAINWGYGSENSTGIREPDKEQTSGIRGKLVRH